MNQKPSPLHRASEWIVDHYRLFFVVFAALLVFSAVASGWVKVENDVAAYLPADSETRQGLDIMEQEFQTYGSAKILLRDTDADAAAATAEQIHAVDGVDSCTYTMNDTGSALLSVSLSDLEGSDTCAQTVQALRDLLDGSGAYIYSAEGYSISDQINGEVRGLLVIVAIILVTVLTFTSSTYAEVPILLITFLAAALINKGTNFVFGTISFVSNAVAILLQLAMSVDYAIIFCNRYKQAHETLPVREAVIESLEKSITVISSSSLTTIAGLVAMTFMKFGLGRDLGIVLIKAILISMLTVFLLMPGLLLMFSRAIEKTKHRSFMPNINAIGRFAWKTHKLVPPVFICVAAAAFFFSSMCPFSYNYSDDYPLRLNETQKAHQQIINTFGNNNMMALVVPTGDYETQAKMLDEISELDHVTSVLGIASVEVMDGYRLGDKLTIGEFSELAGLDDTSASALFVYYAARHADYDQVQSNMREYKIPLIDLFLFLYDVAEDGTIELPQDKIDMIESLYAQLSDAKAQLQGQHYSRMLVYSDLPTQSDASYKLITQIHGVADSYYGDDVYVTGNATAARDLKDSFSTDNILVSVLSAVFVVLVIMFVFRSAGLSVLLIAVIQGSIWLNFSISYFTQNSIFFVGYLIVSAIQMGANIDYAIVVSNRYLELRQRNVSRRKSIRLALNGALPTLVTSGSILVIAGLLIGFISTESIISVIGLVLGRGTIISLLLVLFVLPQMLVWGDRFISRTTVKGRRLRLHPLFDEDFEQIALRDRARKGK